MPYLNKGKKFTNIKTYIYSQSKKDNFPSNLPFYDSFVNRNTFFSLKL